MNKNKPVVLFLMGPTATGKTDLALRLREKIPCELISVDSAKIYRGMDIGTAKPNRCVLEQVPHRLIDICDPAERYSAARFHDDALAEINKIFLMQNKIPLLVGGTGLYFRALEQGLSPLPGADSLIREKLEADAAEIGWPAMHTRLAKIDPQAAAAIHPNDMQRIQRALEIHQITGRKMSHILAAGRQKRLAFNTYKIILTVGDRLTARERIKSRFLSMLKAGLIEEVEALFNRGDLCENIPSMRLVGYRQVWSYLDGKINFKTMQERAIIATCQLLKRQLTWFGSEQQVDWYEGTDKGVLDTILGNIREKPEFSSMYNLL